MTQPDFRALLADDAYAVSFQSLGQYRTALLKALDSTPPPEPSQLSDGYHTFEELYEHRHALTLSLMKARPDLFWFSRKHNDGELCFGDGTWFIVGAELPGVGAITYHLPMRLWEAATHTGATELEIGKPWDGHTATDVVDRLMGWAATPPPEPPTDEELLRKYGKAKRDHCYEGDADDWPKKAERAATVAGLRAVLERWGK